MGVGYKAYLDRFHLWLSMLYKLTLPNSLSDKLVFEVLPFMKYCNPKETTFAIKFCSKMNRKSVNWRANAGQKWISERCKVCRYVSQFFSIINFKELFFFLPHWLDSVLRTCNYERFWKRTQLTSFKVILYHSCVATIANSGKAGKICNNLREIAHGLIIVDPNSKSLPLEMEFLASQFRSQLSIGTNFMKHVEWNILPYNCLSIWSHPL